MRGDWVNQCAGPLHLLMETNDVNVIAIITKTKQLECMYVQGGRLGVHTRLLLLVFVSVERQVHNG